VKSALAATTPARFEVNSYWGGGPLTQLELVCLSSFVHNGAQYNLYTHDEPRGVPEGVIVRDASEILPAERIFQYPAGTLNEGSLSGFSNLFRYTLLQRLGGWWVDTDVCCLRAFETDRDELYVREDTQSGEFLIASCIFRSPSASSVLQHCLEAFTRKDVTKVVHGETGPVLLTDAVCACGRKDAVQPAEQFFPVPWWEYERLLFDQQLPIDSCLAVHFWNTMLRTAGVDKNADFPKNSVFERLKRRYL
jgi:Glycosyltransferase sugar-binding region containing DXD motif